MVFKHVLRIAHVGIYGNEQSDKLAKTAMEKGHRLVPQTASQSLDLVLDKITDDICISLRIVDACLVSTNTMSVYVGSYNKFEIYSNISP